MLHTHELSLSRTENVDSTFYPITSRKPSNTTLRIFPVKYPPKQTFGATFSLLKKCQNQVGQGIPPHFLRRPKHKLTGNFALVYNTSIFSCRKVHSFRIHATFILYVLPKNTAFMVEISFTGTGVVGRQSKKGWTTLKLRYQLLFSQKSLP